MLIPALAFVLATLCLDRAGHEIDLRREKLPEAITLAMSTSDIAGFGEATHGTRESYVVKRLAFQAAVLSCGYRVLALEVPYPDAIALDRYVRTGDGEPRQLVAALGYPFGESELLDTVVWMRNQNLRRNPSNQLRIVGYDMQTPDSAIDRVLEHLSSDDRRRFADLRSAMASGNVLTALSSLTTVERSRILDDADHLVAVCQERKLGPEWLQMAVVARQGVRMAASEAERFSSLGFRAEFDLRRRLASSARVLLDAHGLSDGCADWLRGFTRDLGVPAVAEYRLLSAEAREIWRTKLRMIEAHASSPEQQSAYADISTFLSVVEQYAAKPAERADVRDPSMAENVLWAHRHFGGKVFVSGHNYHVSKLEAPATRMGSVLQRSLGQKYLSVGFAFGAGELLAIDAKTYERRIFRVGPPRPDGLDALLTRARHRDFWLDLRTLPKGPLCDFMRIPQWKREGGSTWEPEREEAAYLRITLSAAYDALIFHRLSSPSLLVKLGAGTPGSSTGR